MKVKNILLVAVFFSYFFANSQENPFSAKWDSGLKIENADKSIKIKMGGRIMYDFGFYSLNSEAKSNGYTLASENGNEFRRARLFTSGTLYNNVDFKLDIDLTGGELTLKDAHITLTKLPVVGNLRIGHFKEPFRFEAQVSSKYMTFMERGFLIDMLPVRSSGFMLFNENKTKRMSWQIALLRGKDNATSDSPAANGDYAITSRIASSVINTEKTLLHLGVSHSFRKPQEAKTFGYSVRPEVHISDKYIKTNVGNVDNVNLFNFASAYVSNSFSMQGEYSTVSVKSSVSNENFNSYYLEASYFLTGEKKVYKNSLVGFSRLKPINNFGSENGFGALEFAIRYSTIDGLENDKMSNITTGLNWYLNPATRIMANYVISNIENNTQFNGEGQFNAFQMRFQIDF